MRGIMLLIICEFILLVTHSFFKFHIVFLYKQSCIEKKHIIINLGTAVFLIQEKGRNHKGNSSIIQLQK